MNSDESKNKKQENLITLYPFNGQSPYLIDKFYIIGYSYLTLEKLLINETPKILEEEKGKEKEKEIKEIHGGSFEIEEEPTILNEITNDYSKDGLDSKTILQMIFPRKLRCYYTWEENVLTLRRSVLTKVINFEDVNDFNKVNFNFDDNSKNTRTIFSSNPQTGKNSKKSINGIAYTFYVEFKKKKTLSKRKYTYYIPYTFCITSEYPFYSSYNKLLNCIKNFYSQTSIYIPIEILIYNIISLTPSPLNSDIILDLKCSLEQDKTFGQFTNAYRHKSTSEVHSSVNINNSNKNIIRNIIDPNKEDKEKKIKFPFNFKRMSSQFVNINKNKIINTVNKKNIYKIEFNFLSGYPLIQYNLPKILFNNLTTEKIITIFLYMFLEKDVLFFSRDIEYLTLTINAYLNLSFPLNDEKYYFIGCAISLDDFIKGDSEFGLKNYTSVIGINDSYDSNYRNNNIKIDDHLVIDLEKGEIIPGEDLKDPTVNEKNKKLIKLIEKMCKESGENEEIRSITLYQAINKSNKRLKTIYEKAYDPSIKSIPDEFIDFNKENIYLMNIEIQESFYEFINNICLYFYENLTIKADNEYNNNITNKDKKEKEKETDLNVIFDEGYNKDGRYNEEELIFLEELKTTMKYESFVYGFLQSYNPIDLYKVPLTFTEEFLSIISRKREEIRGNTYNIKFFKLIDDLYLKRKSSEIIEIDFMITNVGYFKNIKTIFDRFIVDRNKKRYNYDNSSIVRFTTNNQRTLIYQTYELDDNILLKYIHYIKNLSLNEYVQLFSSKFLIEGNTLNKIDVTNIETILENNCIKEKILSRSDICCANILLLFAISLKSLKEAKYCQEFLSVLFQEFTIFRKYYSILFRMVYRLCQAIKDKMNINTTNITLCPYLCINSIRIKKLVPNEDLMKMIKLFNKINMEEYSLPESDKNKKEEKEEKKEMEIYGETLEEKDITNKNLYVFNNFNSQKFFNEKTIVDYVNTTDRDEIVTGTNETIYPRIRFYNGTHKIESFFMSQKSILDCLMKEYDKYIETLDDKKLTSKIILDACLNIFVYMRNNEKFQEMDDIYETLKSIFYIFMNQLFILKSKKENDIKKKQSQNYDD